MNFSHTALDLQQDKKLVYTAMSKNLFYFRMFISTFVIEQGSVPLNPFMIFDYFLLDRVDRNKVREANNNLVKRADEIWVFGPISDGVLAEIMIAYNTNRNVRYFKVVKSSSIIEITPEELMFEDEVMDHKAELLDVIKAKQPA